MSTRTAAALLVALVSLSVLPVGAKAQSGGSDLVATALVLDTPVVNKTTNVDITVQNTGNGPSSPFTVFVGYGKTDSDADCLTGDNSADSGNPTQVAGSGPQACYQQQPSGLGPGQSVHLTFRWNITPAKAFQNNGQVTIVTQIENTCTSPNQNTAPCQGSAVIGGQSSGPDAVTGNNVKPFYASIKIPKVHAWPLRNASAPEPATAPTFVNLDWPRDQVTAPCLDPPLVNAIACVVQPGHAIQSVYHVVNMGNTGDTMTASYAMPALYRDLGYRITFAPPSMALNPGESADVVAMIDVPPQAPAAQSVNVGTSAPTVTLTWSSFVDANVRSDDPGTIAQDCPPALDAAAYCQAATMLPFLVGVKHGLNVTTTLKDNFTTASVGNTTSFNVVANNTGNAPDEYAVTLDRALSTINDSWLRASSLPAPRTLQAGEVFAFQPSIVPPANATKGYYTVAYNVQSTSTDATLPQKVKFTVLLDQWYGLTWQNDNPRQRLVPGESASFRMSVTNPGNGPENLTVSVQNQPNGWFWSVSSTTISLGPHGLGNDTGVLFLNTTIPPNVPAGTAATFFVNVTSNDPPNQPALRPAPATLQDEVDVIAGPNAELSAAVTDQFVDPGNTTTYRVHVRNVGNEASNFSVVARSSSGVWGTTVEPSYLVLAPLNSATGFAEGDVTITLRAPAGVQVGDPESIDHVTLTLTPLTDDGRARSLVLDGRLSGPDLTVARVDANTTTPYGGDPLGLTVRVTNAGNRQPALPVTLSVVALDATGGQTLIGNVSLLPADLRPGSVHDVQVPWDTTGVEGAQVVQATIDPADAIPEIDETNNQASLSLVLRTPNAIRLVPPQDGLSGHPGERVSYDASPDVFQIQYTGNQPSEPVRVEILSEHGWVAPDKAVVNLDLPHLATLPIPVDLTIPALPGTSTDLLTVRVTPVYRPNAPVTATITTSVLDDAPPQIQSVTVDPASIKLGQNATIYATVVDATGLASVRANVVTPTNDVESLLLLPQPDGRFAATQPWLQAGAYGVTIAATDNAVPTPNVNDTHAVLATFHVAPGSAPAIALAPGQATTIHTGSLVLLSITDPLGIAKANYTLGALTYDMGRNYSIDTSNFKAGNVEVLVSAENVYHVAASARFTFTVDNTPPGIHAVTVTPSAPKAGQETTVHVETDAKVTGVSVQIKKDGQVVQTLPATKRSSGVFELTFNPEGGAYTIDVVATDAAGNTKAGQVLFSAKAGNALPGPEVGLVVLSLVALAMVARRKR